VQAVLGGIAAGQDQGQVQAVLRRSGRRAQVGLAEGGIAQGQQRRLAQRPVLLAQADQDADRYLTR
jgi:hypothetical protein